MHCVASRFGYPNYRWSQLVPIIDVLLYLDQFQCSQVNIKSIPTYLSDLWSCLLHYASPNKKKYELIILRVLLVATVVALVFVVAIVMLVTIKVKVKVFSIQATKALRTGGGIVLPYLRPQH